MVNAASFQEDLRAEASALGFAACGFASAATDPLNGERLEEWLGDGRHGSMEWMEARKHQRASPQGLWPDARSVILLAGKKLLRQRQRPRKRLLRMRPMAVAPDLTQIIGMHLTRTRRQNARWTMRAQRVKRV